MSDEEATKVEENRPSPLVQTGAPGRSEHEFSHPFEPESHVFITGLSRLAGLSRTGVSIARVPPGKVSFAFHSHEREEEWIYILSGSGIAEIDDQEFAVGAGDFMGFPTPSVAHNLKNAGDEDLVYLMGGESLAVEIADFPRHGKRMLRRGKGADMKLELYDIDSAEPFVP